MDKGIYVTLDELLALQASAKQISNGQPTLTRNMLQGNRPSKVHGRGGAFDQIRGYLAGDDVRNIDWNVTARMGKPFVRVFNEERETPLLVLADQSADMFFATRNQLKSVVCAKLASYFFWMAHHKKRPCGGIMFGDNGHHLYHPRANTSYLYGILDQLVHYNNALSASNHNNEISFTLTEALQRINRIVTRDAIVVLISDFVHMNQQCWQLVEQLNLKANVIATPVHDGFIQALPNEGQFLASYADLEAELDFSSLVSREKIEQGAQGRIHELNQRFAELLIPVLPFSTYQDVEQQLISGLFIDRGKNV